MNIEQAIDRARGINQVAIATVDATDIDTALAGVPWDDRHETLPGVWEVFGGMDVDEDGDTDDTDAWMIRVVLGAC